MNKYKKIIIIFSLILSILFINVVPVYASTNYYIYIRGTDLVKDVENPVLVVSNKDIYYSTEYLGLSSGNYEFLCPADKSVNNYNIKFYDGDVLLYDGSVRLYNSQTVYVDGAKYPEEETETTETTTEETETTENTEENNNNIIVDNTEVLTELKEIKTYIIMFFGLFLFYFGYKVVKEISNKSLRR